MNNFLESLCPKHTLYKTDVLLFMFTSNTLFLPWMP